ncbi:MAG TPA: AAA family ATPase [Candidatus Saccharimonadales bacterium]|nr:AAA family ATPase [Candidatus Saccharimonadales bacterium]
MAFKQGMSNEMQRRGTNIVIYGPSGAGKTTICGDLADSEFGAPVTIIDVEGGTSVLSHRDDIDILNVTNEDHKGWSDVERIVDDIISGKRGFKNERGVNIGTLVEDNLSELKTLALDHVVRNFDRKIDPKDRPDLNDYGKATTMMLAHVRKLRDFARNSQTNVVFIAWDIALENDSGQVYKNAINLNPAFRRDFPGIVDCVGYLNVVMGRRVLSFEASRMTDAKFRRNGTEVANTIPDVLKYKDRGVKPLVDIINTLTGGIPFPRAKYAGLKDD